MFNCYQQHENLFSDEDSFEMQFPRFGNKVNLKQTTMQKFPEKRNALQQVKIA